MSTKVFRIKSKAQGVYEIEERHRFLWFWTFWIKGSIRFKIPHTYSSPKLAEDAIMKAAEEAGKKVFIMNVDNASEVISTAVKKAKKAKRKKERQEEEKARNLRRIGKEPDEGEKPIQDKKRKPRKKVAKKDSE